ncbi:MAG: YraN family protein [Clostridia bacterium]|nr:YraN family protein [Clostridia bacterium]
MTKKLARRVLGQKGEEIAAGFLMAHGYKILERNFRCRLGEIDIVAQEGDTTVFVEVKTRSSIAYGQAQEAITYRKRTKLRQLGEYYALQYGPHRQDSFRFDVVAIKVSASGQVENIELIRDAL